MGLGEHGLQSDVHISMNAKRGDVSVGDYVPKGHAHMGMTVTRGRRGSRKMKDGGVSPGEHTMGRDVLRDMAAKQGRCGSRRKHAGHAYGHDCYATEVGISKPWDGSVDG